MEKGPDPGAEALLLAVALWAHKRRSPELSACRCVTG